MPTVYLNGYHSSANIHGRALQISHFDPEQERHPQKINIPFFDIDHLIIIGNASITTPTIHQLAYNDIPIHYLSSKGSWLGTFYPNKNGHALRRLKQYQLAGDQQLALTIAQATIKAKLKNSRRVLQRLAANRKTSHEMDHRSACDKIRSLIRKVEEAPNLAAIRGFEGVAAATYFKELGSYFPEDIPFTNRNRRPPLDAANALLSWTYTIVLAEIDAAVRTSGFDPCLGFLHQISYGTPSLSLDLLESLRAPLCDMLVLRLFNHKILNNDHFEYRAEEGGIFLKEEGRKIFFPEYEKTMQRRFSPEKDAPHTDFREIIRKQVNIIIKTMESQDPQPIFYQMR